MQKGVTVWFTGLSGAGKTTISKCVENQLRKRGAKVEVLDGDELRRHLASELGFSRADRMKNIALASYVAHLLTRNGIIVLASFISPYREMRELSRREIGSFIEIYVKCPLEECIRRDVKGLYQKALKGEIAHFTGISDPFEEPDAPELTIETHRETPEESAERVMQYLVRHGYLTP